MKKTEKSNTNEIIEIPAEEAPYALPDGWKWVRLGDLYEVNPKNVAESCIEAAFIPMEKIKPGMVSEFSYEVKPWGIAKKGHTQFADGDVAFAKITPCFENRKSMMLYNLPNGIGAGTTELIVLRQPNVLQKYTFWLINSENFIKGGKNTYSGTVGQQRISMDFVRNYPIPLPPLETQKRIVDRIESLFAKLDEAKEKAQTALDTFELRKSAILHKAFTGQLTAQWREENQAVAVTSEHSDNLTSTPTEGSNGVTSYSEDSNNVTPSSVEYPNNLISVPSSPSNNPNQSDTDSVEQDADKCKESFFIGSEYYQNLVSSNLRLKKSYSMVNSWTYSTLENVCKTIKYGTSKKSEKTGKVVVLRMGNMKNGGLDWSDLAYTNDEEDIKKYWLIPGDVLFNRTNSSEWVGKVSIYRGEMPSIYAGYIIKLDYDRNILNGEYFNYILNSPEEREYCQAVKTDGVNQANINSKKIGAFVIPVPPLPEQQEIVRILDDLLAKENAAKEAAEAVIEKIDLMKKSILARAFRGEL